MEPPIMTEKLSVTEYRLRLSRLLVPEEAAQLRGFFGTAFADEVLLHHHEADGRLRYAYPRVQFKVLDQTAHLIGIAEGGAVVARLWRGGDPQRVRGAALEDVGWRAAPTAEPP